MTNDPYPKPISYHPRDPDSATPLSFFPAPKTCHRQDRWPPEPQQQLAAALAVSGASQKQAPILAKNGGLAANFSGSGPPAVFSLWGV